MTTRRLVEVYKSKECRTYSEKEIECFINEALKTNEAKHFIYSAAAIKRHANKKYRAKHLKVHQALAKDPEWIRKNAEKNKTLAKNPEWKKSHDNAAKANASNPEWIKRVREGHKKLMTPVVCIETGIFFEGLSVAAKEINLDASNIKKTIDGKHKTAGGYHWRYATPEEIEAHK